MLGIAVWQLVQSVVLIGVHLLDLFLLQVVEASL